MNPLFAFVILLAVHWVADFVCQTHWMATNKSKNHRALMAHVGVYSLMLFIATAALFGLQGVDRVMVFVLINAALHLATDFFTSRLSSALWSRQRWHDFFVVIGADQLIHQICLAVTMFAIFSRG